MATRKDKVKQITVTIHTFDRFKGFKEYNENAEGTLIKLMDYANKYLNSKNHKRKED